jgi:hypothetical protein
MRPRSEADVVFTALVLVLSGSAKVRVLVLSVVSAGIELIGGSVGPVGLVASRAGVVTALFKALCDVSNNEFALFIGVIFVVESVLGSPSHVRHDGVAMGMIDSWALTAEIVIGASLEVCHDNRHSELELVLDSREVVRVVHDNRVLIGALDKASLDSHEITGLAILVECDELGVHLEGLERVDGEAGAGTI